MRGKFKTPPLSGHSYHRRLKALVALELKAGAFKPEYAGKMSFYLTVLNEKIRTEEEAASIGIGTDRRFVVRRTDISYFRKADYILSEAAFRKLLCKDKDRTTVEYALKDMSHPIGVASYRVTSEVPHAYKEYLPSPEVITGSISNILDVLVK